ncbi:MAG TPA: hypothetical protein ENI39_05000 [Anaerolineae bacterium]|nr:hypothetical protein [Anaerolineae bacterium]
MPDLLELIAERTQTQAQELERVRAMAPEEAQAGLARAQEVCQRGHEAAMSALMDPQVFRQRYQHREGMPDEVEPPGPPTDVPPVTPPSPPTPPPGGRGGKHHGGW